MASPLPVWNAQFWTLCRISPGSNSLGYRNQSLPIAQTFFQDVFQPTLAEGSDEHTCSIALLKVFRDSQSSESALVIQRAHAGLCLRSWISHPILKACMKLANLFGSTGQFSYRELLPFVLTDDGESWVIPTDEGCGYQRVTKTGLGQDPGYICFGLEVLRTYQLNRQIRSLSLTNWVYLQTKQQPDLINFLAEFGFQKLSDWALLNRVGVRQMEQLSERDRTLVNVFHQVYRRDRRLMASTGRCPNPSPAQLEEMTLKLAQRSITIETSLLHNLHHIATQLRQYDIWQSRESLEQFDANTGQFQTLADLPTTTLDTEMSEESEILAMLQQQLKFALEASLHQSLRDRLARLKQSKRYAPFADQFVTGLRYYYRDSLSLKEIPPRLGMSSRDQARRVLNPRELMNEVRSLTLQKVLAQVLAIVQAKALTPWPPSPNYLQQLSEQLEAFVDDEYFRAAVTEMKAGSYRNLDSPYAQTLLKCLDSFES